mmetsp:Transcript_34516/g.42535  ORF Transcript_34516/g.42535 Transcript_34516/m.42535 type:complete len:81 (+) Transcript_34516:617-859(+)
MQNSTGPMTPLCWSALSSWCFMVNAAKPNARRRNHTALKKPPNAETATRQGCSLETVATISTTSMVKGMNRAQQHMAQAN